MAIANIIHKHIMTARNAARRDSDARISGKSIFIKRHNGKYWIIGVNVSKEQRKCRDIFADAQKLASYEIKQWNRRRHWGRLAKKHKINGAHRMAVSYFYKLLKENEVTLKEELVKTRMGRHADYEMFASKLNKLRPTKKIHTESEETSVWVNELYKLNYWIELDKASPFYYRKFGNIKEYYDVVMKLAG